MINLSQKEPKIDKKRKNCIHDLWWNISLLLSIIFSIFYLDNSILSLFFSNFSFLSSNFSIIKPPWVKFQIPILHYFVKCSHDNTSSSYICRICMLLYYFYFTSSFISFLPYISRHKVSKYRIFISSTLISAICHNYNILPIFNSFISISHTKKIYAS